MAETNNFEQIKKLELRRKENMRYTLGDDSIDRLWGLDQDYAALTPKPEAVKEFAAAAYLFGSLGFATTNFTAVPAGYVATFKKGGEIQTVIISGSDKPYYMKDLIAASQKELAQQSNTSGEKDFYESLISSLKEGSLLASAHTASVKIKESKSERLANNVKQAIFPFSGDSTSLNSQNCSNNHKILAAICCKQLGITLSDEIIEKYITNSNDIEIPDNLPKDDILKVKDLYKQVYSKWIIPGYFTYVGHDRGGNPLARDGKILNSRERTKELHSLIKGKKSINAIINMCATDYTADMVFVLLNLIEEAHEVSSEKMIEQSNEILAPAGYMEDEKSQTRKTIRTLTHAENDQDIEL